MELDNGRGQVQPDEEGFSALVVPGPGSLNIYDTQDSIYRIPGCFGIRESITVLRPAAQMDLCRSLANIIISAPADMTPAASMVESPDGSVEVLPAEEHELRPVQRLSAEDLRPTGTHPVEMTFSVVQGYDSMSDVFRDAADDPTVLVGVLHNAVLVARYQLPPPGY